MNESAGAPMAEPRLIRPGEVGGTSSQERVFVIRELEWETGDGDVFTWTLEAEDGAPFHFQPGQFNMVNLWGVGEVPISISGDAESGVLVHTTRAVGGVTRALQKCLPGDRIGIRGPFGSAWPVDAARGGDLLIVAGGIGLAPLRPVVYHALRHRAEYRRVCLLYGTRTPLDILYRDELERWEREGDIDVLVTVDRAAGGWRGHVGVVTRLLDAIAFDPATAVAVSCGPEIMMHFTALGLQKQGVGADRIWLSMERNMKCAIGHCGHCQWGPFFVCRDGPVFRLDRIQALLNIEGL